MNIFNILAFSDVMSKIGNIIIDVLVFVLILGVIVGIHEAGHMLFAKRAKYYAVNMLLVWDQRFAVRNMVKRNSI